VGELADPGDRRETSALRHAPHHGRRAGIPHPVPRRIRHRDEAAARKIHPWPVLVSDVRKVPSSTVHFGYRRRKSCTRQCSHGRTATSARSCSHSYCSAKVSDRAERWTEGLPSISGTFRPCRETCGQKAGRGHRPSTSKAI
jgi:hypothetical protein